MPVSSQLTIPLSNQPGTLARACRALAEQKVNILALQYTTSEKSALVRLVVDDPEKAKRALDNEGLSYDETPVAVAKLQHRPGELSRAASRLAEVEMNVEYAYCGLDPVTHAPVVVFGVPDVDTAALILDRSIAAA